ncbi:threonine/serine exporter family protein [Spelaeicoccus albus]|uniref:Uncharacterized membrane protein YjjP (DUF1212 family) n=1 Tax=Spelaeicoccus albus TaxID=1280376 RepID=A0A7Z0CZ59_9MICO|nr:threonine/serine exporter family protein [Spelaeicoccus albus]NYI65949.1 uncharacterized membrane protein YjjP (DUF1212 family) [Spelaeicoccus albus]
MTESDSEPQTAENAQVEEAPVDDAQVNDWAQTGPSPLIGTAPTSNRQSRRAEKIARRAVNRIIADNSPITQPIPIVERLRNTPYSHPVQRAAPDDSDARITLDFALRLGETMLRAGASNLDVETSIIAACAACGLEDLDVELTYQSIIVHYTTADGRPLTVLGVNRGESINYGRLAAVHRLVLDLVAGKLDQVGAAARLDAIIAQPKPFNRWLVTVVWAVLAGTLTVLIGGGWIGAAVGTIITFVMSLVGRQLQKTGIPYFFVALATAAVTTTVAMALARLGVPLGPQFVVSAGIMLLLPTITFVSTVQDAISGFPITAAGRLVNVFVVLAAIVAGVGVGLAIGQAIGLKEIDVLIGRGSPALARSLLAIILSFVVSVLGAVGNQSLRRLVVPSGLIGMIGYIVWISLGLLDWGNVLVAAIAAAVVAGLARIVTDRRDAPALVVIVPGLFPLLPGLKIFTGIYQLTQPNAHVSMTTGMTTLVAALLWAAALGIGSVLGTFVANPGMLKSLRRRKPPVNRSGTLSDE